VDYNCGVAAMAWTSWPLTEDNLSSTAEAVTGTDLSWMATDGSSNWKTLMLGLFVFAGVTGKCVRKILGLKK